MKHVFKFMLGIIVLMAWLPIMLFKLFWNFKYYSLKDYHKLILREMQKMHNEQNKTKGYER